MPTKHAIPCTHTKDIIVMVFAFPAWYPCVVLDTFYFSSKTTVFLNILFFSGGWVEDMVEDDGEAEIL